jgi:hypothetical protein
MKDKAGALLPQRRPINRLDQRDAFNGLIQVKFQSQIRSTPMLQAEFSANAEKAAPPGTKTPVIQGDSKWHSACSLSSVALERKRT